MPSWTRLSSTHEEGAFRQLPDISCYTPVLTQDIVGRCIYMWRYTSVAGYPSHGYSVTV